MGYTARILTNANMGLQDHADIISSISNGQSDWVLLGGFDQLHNLERQQRKSVIHELLQQLNASAHIDSY